jgi:hypothetical protein
MQAKPIRINVKAGEIALGDRLVLGRKLGLKTVQRVEPQAAPLFKASSGRVTLRFTEGWGYGFDTEKVLTVERDHIVTAGPHVAFKVGQLVSKERV